MTERRLLFGSMAQQYDAHRPSSPQQFVSDVLEYVGQPSRGVDVVEVGAGTGIATRRFAPLVKQITAIEPDPEMSAVAAARPDAPGNVTHLHSDFEHAQLPSQGFDLLVSASAWHWVTPKVWNRLAADVLKPGGVLAAFWNAPEWNRTALQPQLQKVYREVVPDVEGQTSGTMRPGDTAGPGGQLHLDAPDSWQRLMSDEPRFGDLQVRHYHWIKRYTADQYTTALGTHSDHMLLPSAVRERLMHLITTVINEEGHGTLELPYHAILCLAR